MALRPFSFSFKAMACLNEIYVYAENQNVAQSIAGAAIAEANRLEQRYSRYLTTSLLSAINSSSGDPAGITVDPETAGLLDYAQTCFEQSDGLFDVTSGALRRIWNFREARLPSSADLERILSVVGWHKVRWNKPVIALPVAGMELDFGGIVKEYAADACANVCRNRGIKHGMVNMGGDIHVIGPHPDGKPWKIGIQNPRSPSEVITTTFVAHGGLASSGDYQRSFEIDGQRYSHILNPKTGWPVQGLAAVTVIAPNCLIAGSTSTIGMLRGDEGNDWLKKTGLPYLCVDHAGRRYSSSDVRASNTGSTRPDFPVVPLRTRNSSQDV